MARTAGVNKSKAIREYFGTNPKAKAKEVVEALAKKDISVTESLVYGVKGAMAEKRGERRIAKAAIAASASATGKNGAVPKSDALTMIREVKALAAKAGGYDKLKELVDALAE